MINSMNKIRKWHISNHFLINKHSYFARYLFMVWQNSEIRPKNHVVTWKNVTLLSDLSPSDQKIDVSCLTKSIWSLWWFELLEDSYCMDWIMWKSTSTTACCLGRLWRELQICGIWELVWLLAVPVIESSADCSTVSKNINTVVIKISKQSFFSDVCGVFTFVQWTFHFGSIVCYHCVLRTT